MYQPEHAAHTSRTAHHDDRVQYLVVADSSSLAQLELELSALPLCARGRVFIEVDAADEVRPIGVPPRMTVAWLSRATRAARTAGTVLRPRGAVLERAVRAWTGEMLCDGPGATHAVLTGDYPLVSELYDHLVREIGMPVTSIATPEAYRLQAG